MARTTQMVTQAQPCDVVDNLWSYRWLQLNQCIARTTLIKANWIIVQQQYHAGPRLNYARDVNLSTKVVTEKEQLGQH